MKNKIEVESSKLESPVVTDLNDILRKMKSRKDIEEFFYHCGKIYL